MNAGAIRRILAVLAVAALTLVSAGAAPAAARVTQGEMELALFFDDRGYALVTGPTFEEGCAGNLPIVTSRVIEKRNLRIEHGRGTNFAFLYDLEAEGATNAWNMIEIVCEALAAGEPMPEPLAQGTTHDRLTNWERPDRTGQLDWSFGTLRTPDGDPVRVSARSSFTEFTSGNRPPRQRQILRVRGLD